MWTACCPRTNPSSETQHCVVSGMALNLSDLNSLICQVA